MASILDSVWVSGPQQTGSSCGLTGAAMDRPARRPLDLSPAGPAGPAAPEPAANVSRLPAEVQEALLQLNRTAEDCLRHPDELRLSGAAPTLLRVLGVLLFNAFVLWSNFGAPLVAPPIVAPSRLMLGSGAAGIDGLPSWRPDGKQRMTPSGVSSAGDEEVASAVQAARAAAETSGGEDASRSSTLSRTAAPDSEAVVVPWSIQLAYFATLVVVVVGIPCCPTVLENACVFLMC